MSIRSIVLSIVLCLNFLAIAKPWGGGIVLSQPRDTIAPADWNEFAENLKPMLGKVFDLQPKADRFNLEVEVHGAATAPYYQLQKKQVRLFDIPDDAGEEYTGVFTYAIGGNYAQAPASNDYVCRVRVDLPLNNPVEKNLIYTYKNEIELLMSEHAQTYAVMGYFANTIYKNIKEICYVGYWGYTLQKPFQSYDDVNRFLLQKIRQEVLQEYPSLSSDTKALGEEIMRRFKEINTMQLREDELPQT